MTDSEAFVISDLHLSSDTECPMLTRVGQLQLACFIDLLRERQKQGVSVHLILAGDIVDVLQGTRLQG